jgi:hypothetical protein
MSRSNPSSVTRVRCLLATLAAIAAIAGDTGASPAATRASDGTASGAAVVSVGRATVGPPVPAGFVGVSTEIPAIEEYAGSDPRALNPVLEQLIRNLAPGQRPVLRIGGDSTDWSWYQVGHSPRPPWVRYTVTPNWIAVTHALAQALDARLILGINLEADSSRLARGEANALINGIGRQSIEALEIGNEPELYSAFAWYHNRAGVRFFGRPSSYDVADFTSDFAAIASSLPRIVLAGPAIGAADWLDELGSFLATQPRVGVATVHAYPLKRCSASAHVTVEQLLSEASSIGLADSVVPYVAVAHAHHRPLRIDEMNSVTCGGEPGVSDSFASALWSLDTMFAMASVGVDGVNLHTVPNGTNELFAFKLLQGKWQGYVHPDYYGLMMFEQAAPPGSRLLKLSGTTQGAIRAWATRAPDGHVRVVLINTQTARPQLVAVRAPSAGGPAALERLTAPSTSATSGLSLGGQSFGSATTTGLLPTAQSTSVKPSGGEYLVRLPAASAAMLTLAK